GSSRRSAWRAGSPRSGGFATPKSGRMPSHGPRTARPTAGAPGSPGIRRSRLGASGRRGISLARALDLLERFDIGGILEPSGALGFDQVVESDQGNPDPIHLHGTRVRYRLLVLDPP